MWNGKKLGFLSSDLQIGRIWSDGNGNGTKLLNLLRRLHHAKWISLGSMGARLFLKRVQNIWTRCTSPHVRFLMSHSKESIKIGKPENTKQTIFGLQAYLHMWFCWCIIKWIKYDYQSIAFLKHFQGQVNIFGKKTGHNLYKKCKIVSFGSSFSENEQPTFGHFLHV